MSGHLSTSFENKIDNLLTTFFDSGISEEIAEEIAENLLNVRAKIKKKLIESRENYKEKLRSVYHSKTSVEEFKKLAIERLKKDIKAETLNLQKTVRSALQKTENIEITEDKMVITFEDVGVMIDDN